MPIGEQTDQHSMHQSFLTHEDLIDLLDDPPKRVTMVFDFLREIGDALLGIRLLEHDFSCFAETNEWLYV
jgi:hypothetical protein